MKRNFISRLLLLVILLIVLYSCRNDHFPEQDTYNNTGKFNLTSKTISLNESKHKSKLVSELSKAEIGLKSMKTDASGKVVNYGNGVSIGTDNVIYIENGPNYHTYTFRINRENAPTDAPVENLLLVPLPDGSYRELLVTYNLTEQEKIAYLQNKVIDPKKVKTVELTKGTYNGGGELAKTACGYINEIVWQECSEHVHNQYNTYDWDNCTATIKPNAYFVTSFRCWEEQDDVITSTPIDGGTSSSGGGGSGNTSDGGGATAPPCDTSTIPSNPEPGLTDINGCPIGTPTLPNLGENPKTPCEKIKEQRNDDEFKKRMDTLQDKTGLKKETGYIQKWGGDYVYKDNASATDQANSLSLPEVATNTYVKGFAHTHVNDFEFTETNGDTGIRLGIKIPSPADVGYFMDLVQNAQTNGHPLGDVYGIMISSMKNYQLRFTGNQYQIKTFTDEQLNSHREPYKEYTRAFLGDSKKLEFKFLKYIDEKMNLKGITLYRMNADGITTEIKLNADKTDITETNCPN
ncbi:hypothetical protein [Chryseobacterium daecheongense]|uniref:Lipoprotein n=1 Tax=Chryseobacterium daecheongense TaxID=192389 RepID=A0A3N0W590_9FLAO|nr:hypothetical protein [Chryseobacterium daecheongense]ROI00222.1 hypothetical protein EGI05_04880 [Chryseobacterium daecheongense]TDX94821.1 hypothetical protein BCF50_0592 [Chryseobacterium daecheongense]